jgi:PAS domain S-box-containing protein
MLNSLIVADPEGRIRTVNRATCALLGYTEQDLVGQPLARIVDSPLSEGGEYREQHNVEVLYRTRNGKRLTVLFSSALLRDAKGAMQGVVCVAQDLTERNRAEAALRAYAQDLARSNAELEQFAYVASHDLQEPLRMVASYTQLLARRYKGRLDADADEFITFAVDAATRMQRLINDLLAYSRVGTKGKPFETTNLSDVMNHVLASLKLAIEESGARVAIDPLPTLMADPVQMGQLFQNLLGNAIKFRKPDTPLDIRMTASLIREEWFFTFSDNGIGFDPEYAERIFVIFQRLHTSSEYPGTGIGLAICKKIVERHGGRIWADSKPGQGAVFSFTLPLEPPVTHA